MAKHRIYTTSFAAVYPHYVAKAEKKGRTKAEVDQVISWLTGYGQKELETQLEKTPTLKLSLRRPLNQSFASLDQRRGLRCPGGGYRRTNHARDSLPG